MLCNSGILEYCFFFPKEYDRQRIHWPYAPCPTVSVFVRTVYHQSTEGRAGIPVAPKSQIQNPKYNLSSFSAHVKAAGDVFLFVNCIVVIRAHHIGRRA